VPGEYEHADGYGGSRDERSIWNYADYEYNGRQYHDVLIDYANAHAKGDPVSLYVFDSDWMMPVEKRQDRLQLVICTAGFLALQAGIVVYMRRFRKQA
jgi:hypothetical protein